MFSQDLTGAEEVWFSWQEPHELAIALAEEMLSRGMRRGLDVGCGGGRHLLYLAEQGFEVYGTDRSETGLAIARERLGMEGLRAVLRRCDMTEVPFPDEFFDVLLSGPGLAPQCIREHRESSGGDKKGAQGGRVVLRQPAWEGGL